MPDWPFHRTDTSLLLFYVDHHDRAYAWGERRKLETHPTTGAAQIVEIRESVREIVVPTYVPAPATPKPATKPLAGFADEVLLSYGVPAEWMTDVREAEEDGLLVLTAHLPAEAAEAVLELATGGTPVTAKLEVTSCEDHTRRFTMSDDLNESRRPHPQPMAAPYLEFDVARELQQLHREAGWDSGQNARTLVKHDGLRIVLVALKAGSRIPEHHTEGQISIHTVVGHIRVRAQGRTFELRAGGLLALDQDLPHDVEALEESAFILTIAWPGRAGASSS